MIAAGALLALLLAAPAPSKAEEKLLERVAGVWADYALDRCLANDRAEAQAAWERGRKAHPSFDADGKLAARIEAIDGEPRAGEARKKKAFRDAAKLYDRLAKYDDKHVFEAIALEPARKRLSKAVRLVKSERDAGKAGLYLAKLRAADPEGDYADLESGLAREDVVLVKAKDHAMVGWLALPKSWKKGKSYPVLVTVDGAGSNFLGACRGSRKHRGSRDWIILAPCTFANTNALKEAKYPWYEPALLQRMAGVRDRFGWDVAGLEGLLAVARERYGGEEKIAITGFSGGGNLCYGYTLLHPRKVRLAVPACANFAGLGARDGPRPEDGGPPILVYTGAQDPHRDWTHGKKGSPGIEPQTDAAVEVLADKGFTNVKREMLPGVKHSALHGKVWEAIDALR